MVSWVPRCKQSFGNMRADEAGAAGEQIFREEFMGTPAGYQ